MSCKTRAQQHLRWVSVATVDMGRKERAAVPISQGELGPCLTQYGLGRGLLLCQVSPSSIQPFGHNRHGPKTGWLCSFWRRELRHHLTQRRLGRGLPPYQVASWSIQPFGHNTHGPKIGWGSAFFLAGSGSPSNTKSPGLKPTSIPSGILVHPAFWPQRTLAENWGGCAPLWEGELGPHLTQCCP